MGHLVLTMTDLSDSHHVHTSFTNTHVIHQGVNITLRIYQMRGVQYYFNQMQLPSQCRHQHGHHPHDDVNGIHTIHLQCMYAHHHEETTMMIRIPIRKKPVNWIELEYNSELGQLLPPSLLCISSPSVHCVYSESEF